ncbi:aldo/keto reductase [Jannaschia sp. M317]|uniref:aldo/keto reductase n=1 Tax=Jannaschia sp. M317 TaxID=2867011 RepID=UPI0021A442D8|nr:aldo/keto reductase [Jannaschia sp. M317]UWQ18044.1 aldo/keto reductase [Jannaschia sp. M317]
MILTPDHTLSFGTASIGGLYAPVTSEAAHEVLQSAWDAGIRYFDTAPHYGNGASEHRLGDFLRDKSDWILSTKVGRILTPDRNPPAVVNGFHSALPLKQHFDFGYDAIMRSVEDSFQRLGLNRIDILFVHDIGDPGAGTDTAHHRAQLRDSGAKALRALKEQGVVSAVGLGVNTVEICEDLLGQMEIDLILLAGRYTLLEQTARDRLFPLLDRYGAKLVIGGVFNSGILATGPVAGAQYNYAPAPPKVLSRVAEIEAICTRHDVPMAAAAIQYPARDDHVVSTLIGTSKPGSLLRNVTQFRSQIPAALWDDLRTAELIA